MRCEERFGAPQDVEWAIAGDRFHLLQSRPVTTLGRDEERREVKGKWVLFKAIAENFTDPITPLTADLLSVLFGPGLRFIGGRLYMNLELLAPLVPFGMSDEDMADAFYLAPRSTAAALRLSLRKLPLTLLAGLLSISRPASCSPGARMPDASCGLRSLCGGWRRPDPRRGAGTTGHGPSAAPGPPRPHGHDGHVSSLRFAPWMAALKYMLGRCVPRLRPDAGALLSSGSEGVLSAEMGRGIRALAAEARRDASARDILSRHEPGEALSQLRQDPGARGFVARLDAFLAIHGHRAIKEFEIRTARWEEDPTPFWACPESPAPSARMLAPASRRRPASAASWRARFARRRPSARGLLGCAGGSCTRRSPGRYYLKLRENSRFYHTWRSVSPSKVLAIEAELRSRAGSGAGRHLLPEVERVRAARALWADGRRRPLRRGWSTSAWPGQRRGRSGSPDGRRGRCPATRSASREAGLAGATRRGPRILDPSVDLTLRPGEVLVAPYTDPAWTPLFLVAGAAVVEVGSYLSHAGTVAREYGLPCVVDVADCTRRIPSGARVQVDGSTGVVRILAERTA